MADAAIRGIVREVVMVLEENPSLTVENLLARSSDRALKCLRHDALITRFKALVGYLSVKSVLKLYNAGKFSASLDVLKIVRAMVNRSRNVSPRDVAALNEEIAQFGKNNFFSNV